HAQELEHHPSAAAHQRAGAADLRPSRRGDAGGRAAVRRRHQGRPLGNLREFRTPAACRGDRALHAGDRRFPRGTRQGAAGRKEIQIEQGEEETQMSLTKSRLAGLAIAGALSAYVCTPAVADLDPAHKGGTMRLVAVGAGGTIDPHINYTLQYWQLYQSIYDGLVTFKHAAGPDRFTIAPHLPD